MIKPPMTCQAKTLFEATEHPKSVSVVSEGGESQRGLRRGLQRSGGAGEVSTHLWLGGPLGYSTSQLRVEAGPTKSPPEQQAVR